MLGSADGSVKQWDVDGGSPSYGAPFLDETGIGVDAIAFSSDGQVLGADRQGRLSEWRRSDARPMRTIPIADVPLEVVAVSEQGDQAAVARGSLYPDIQIVNRMTGAIGAPLQTSLWGVNSIAFGHGGVLFTAGHWYGVPMIERRAVAAPGDVIESWADMAMTAHVQAIAVDPSVTRMVAGGDDFVAVLEPKALEAGTTIVRDAPGHRAIDVALLGRAVFATAGEEGTLRLWNAATAEPIAMLAIPEPIGLGVDARGETVFTSGPERHGARVRLSLSQLGSECLALVVMQRATTSARRLLYPGHVRSPARARRAAGRIRVRCCRPTSRRRTGAGRSSTGSHLRAARGRAGGGLRHAAARGGVQPGMQSGRAG